MTRSRCLVAVLVLSLSGLAVASRAIAQSGTPPPDRALRSGQTVRVDDGSCPPGQIREITGGSKDKSIPRTTRCVARDAPPASDATPASRPPPLP